MKVPAHVMPFYQRFPVKELPTGNFRTCPARLSFPALFTPKSMEANKRPTYQATLLFPRFADLTVLRTVAEQTLRAKFGNTAKLGAGYRSPFRDQSEKARFDGYEDGWFIPTNAPDDKRPGVVGPSGQPIGEADIYAGCWVIATLRPYAYDNKMNKGAAFGLQNIQKIADDEALAGKRANPDEEFESLDGTYDAGSAFAGTGGGLLD